MGKTQEMQRLIRAYKDEKKVATVDMHKVAKWAAGKGWPLPKPQSPLDLLAKKFAQAARQETKVDNISGDPYRVNHSFPVKQGDEQLHLWIDIDEAPRGPMLKSLVCRREQMIGDGLQLTFDAEHWNRINSGDDPIEMDMDFTLDIEWRRNGKDDEEGAA
ncbi:MAG: hypothetical protein EP347_04180 [Alphaproteobacteria bacterium]|nr:MAG: hypothetical protein EP347_04180 [Alphaproteobacteria bacterium]